MRGCKKNHVKEDWIKLMLDWDIFTHTNAEKFSKYTPDKEKIALSIAWKNYMKEKNIWISFYEWKAQQEFCATFCRNQ